MKNKFYFFNAGFRTPSAWKQTRTKLSGVCEDQGAVLILEKSNEEIIRGAYRKEEAKTITTYDKDGQAKLVEFKTFAGCEFFFKIQCGLLIIKNPSRGSIRSLVTRFQDASFFQMFAEPASWDLWDAFSGLEGDNTDRVVSRIDVLSYPYSSVMEGDLIVTGKLTMANIERFRKGRLARLHGNYGGKASQRFVISANGILKVTGSMNFDEALAFSTPWLPDMIMKKLNK